MAAPLGLRACAVAWRVHPRAEPGGTGAGGHARGARAHRHGKAQAQHRCGDRAAPGAPCSGRAPRRGARHCHRGGKSRGAGAPRPGSGRRRTGRARRARGARAARRRRRGSADPRSAEGNPRVRREPGPVLAPERAARHDGLPRRGAREPHTGRGRDERTAARDGGDRALRKLQPRPADVVPAHAGRPGQAVPAGALSTMDKPANKVMIVTGGGRGIGAATARLAAKQGYAVCINYVRDRAAAENVVADIAKAGGKAIAVRCDVSLEPDVLNLFQQSDRALGRLGALVNNAGIVDRSTRVELITAARLARMFAVNVTGSFLCAREAVKRMSKKHGGSGGAIVNVSSIAAKLGSPGDYVDYAASKGAIDTFTVGLSKEVGAEGIRVNAVRPGVIRTEIHAISGDPARVERIGQASPLQRAGEPEEIARAILWLASEEASYLTGAIVDVSGGR